MADRPTARRFNVYVADSDQDMFAEWREFLAATGTNASEAVADAVRDYRPFRTWLTGREIGRREAQTAAS